MKKRNRQQAERVRIAVARVERPMQEKLVASALLFLGLGLYTGLLSLFL